MSSQQQTTSSRPALSRSLTISNGLPTAPASTAMLSNMTDSSSKNANAILELSDGSAYQGISFGATDKSVAGECVFQTGALLFGNFPG